LLKNSQILIFLAINPYYGEEFENFDVFDWLCIMWLRKIRRYIKICYNEGWLYSSKTRRIHQVIYIGSRRKKKSRNFFFRTSWHIQKIIRSKQARKKGCDLGDMIWYRQMKRFFLYMASLCADIPEFLKQNAKFFLNGLRPPNKKNFLFIFDLN